MTTETPTADTRTQRRPRPVLILALLTLLLFGGGGAALIHAVQGRDVLALHLGPWVPWAQLLTGLATGTVMGLFALWMVHRPFMAPILERYSSMIGPWMSRRSDRLLVSICAGVGEELFFRGALQFWLGIPVTAILFVAIHGYLDPRNWRITIYGVAMTAMIMLLGYMAEHQGLLAPMAAHTMIDVVLLEGLHRAWRKQRTLAPPSAT
jgi:uncharacterized protein